jgi:hypothetical protein
MGSGKVESIHWIAACSGVVILKFMLRKRVQPVSRVLTNQLSTKTASLDLLNRGALVISDFLK